MTDYGLTANGFTSKSLDVLRSEVEDYQRLNIDAGLGLSDDDSLGAANVALLNQAAEIWETLEALYASRDPDTATDWSLTTLCKITGTKQSGYTKTIIRDVSVTLNPNKALPIGSIAHMSGRPNSRFLSMAEVPADPDGGTFLVDFEAETAEALVVVPDQLTEISVAVSGWTAVNNTLSGETGSEPEDNPELREKRDRELEAQGATTVESIAADVSSLEGVVDVVGIENKSRRWVNGVPPNSFHIIVRGGTESEILHQIFNSKAGGIQPFGGVIGTVTDSEGADHTIAYSQGTSLTFYADITLSKSDDWDLGTEDLVKEQVAAYINGLGLGNDVIYTKVGAWATVSDGVYSLDSLQIGFTASPSTETDLTVESVEYATADVANINITWTP